MADLNLNILVIDTHDVQKLGILDNSIYASVDPGVDTQTISITPPEFDAVTLSFQYNNYNIYNSEDLGITEIGEDLCDLPDGVYYITYNNNTGGTVTSVNKTIIRIDKLQEKFDEAFMSLDMIECDGKIKKQSKVHLMSIYFFIQGAISAANNCAVNKSNSLYNKADAMLDNFIKNDCGCSGNNYIITYF